MIEKKFFAIRTKACIHPATDILPRATPTTHPAPTLVRQFVIQSSNPQVGVASYTQRPERTPERHVPSNRQNRMLPSLKRCRNLHPLEEPEAPEIDSDPIFEPLTVEFIISTLQSHIITVDHIIPKHRSRIARAFLKVVNDHCIDLTSFDAHARFALFFKFILAHPGQNI